jgi:hypothetical protein
MGLDRPETVFAKAARGGSLFLSQKHGFGRLGISLDLATESGLQVHQNLSL